LTNKQIEDALKVKIDLTIPDMPKQMRESLDGDRPALEESAVLRGAIVTLAREVGFAGTRDDAVDQFDAPKKLSFLQKLFNPNKVDA
jgi:pilus assembly protein CpaE